ncbi:hypothetical protein FOA52_010525 [Chlamydomonas sp. UWO 241]|nr:hypothetical protein FOA52_010525 [Chlamydomonas sp. UWO 241]
MSLSLSNLPASGLLSADVSCIVWDKRGGAGARPFTGGDGVPEDGEQQVLENDNATESLVRILRRQQDAKARSAAAAAPQQRGGVKRPAEGAAGGAGGGQKRLAIAPSLASGAAGPSRGAAPGAGLSGAAGPSGAGGADTNSNSKRVYSQEELRSRSVKELSELCKARNLPVTGKKEVLMGRLIDLQRRQKQAALGPGAAS